VLGLLEVAAEVEAHEGKLWAFFFIRNRIPGLTLTLTRLLTVVELDPS